MKKISIDIKKTREIAQLAALELNTEELEKIKIQLAETLNYVAILNLLNTDKQPPTCQVTGKKNVYRTDEVKPGFLQEQALSGTKKTKHGYFQIASIY